MADKQIGIKLDVKQTGLQQVDDGLDSISKNLADINQRVLKQQQKGWGSEAQTKELREQLRYMNQMVQLYERMARTVGANSESFGNFKGEIGKMQGDLNGLPSYRSRVGGFAQDRFGQQFAQKLDKMTSAFDKVGAAVMGVNVVSTIMSGLGRGDQLAFGYGDIYKRMGGTGSAMGYAQGAVKGLNRYGYDDLATMNATQTYTNATGRMPSNVLQEQMQAILSTGRRFGWSDPNQAAQVFGSAFSSGVTGGAAAQMSPQQFATLVANATSQAHMQGREQQMLQQLQQVTQMSIQSMGKAGDTQTMSAFLAMGDKTGNQALIGNLPNMISNINSGISNPSGGYGSQALMMRAIGGGKMSFWQEQYQQSLGAFGVNPNNGKTNVENATNYLMKSFGGDKYRQAAMLGQMFNMNPSQAMQFIDTYTKNGKFDSDSLNQLKSSMNTPAAPVPMTDTDKMRQGMVDKQTGADNFGMHTTDTRSKIGSTLGDVLGSNIVGTAGEVGAYGWLGYQGYKGAKGVVKGGSKLFKMFKGRGGAATGSAAAGEAGAVVGGEAAAGAETLAAGAEAAEIAGTVGTMEAVGAGLDMTGIGALIGIPLAAAGIAYGGYKLSQLGKKKKSAPASSGTPPVMIGPPDVSQGSDAPSAVGTQLAPIVASTIVALAPYMSQIRSVLGDGSPSGSSSASALSSPHVIPSLLSASSNKGGVVLASYSGGRSGSSGGAVSTSSFSGADDFVKQMLPYAQQVSQQTGLPADFVLAQWAHESGWGTSSVSKTNNNFGGIKPWSGAAAGSNKMYAGYSSLGDFASGYSQFLKQNGRYSKLLGAAKNGASADQLADIMGSTGYAEDPSYTSKLHSVIGSVHKRMDEAHISSSAGSKIKIDGGTLTINVQSDSGTQKISHPISAEYTGLVSA